jgi:hypothetical protein
MGTNFENYIKVQKYKAKDTDSFEAQESFFKSMNETQKQKIANSKKIDQQ